MPHILVIDDEPLNRELLMTLLSHQGHTVVVAADGIEGLRIAKATQLDLIITDILMPAMDGYALATRVRADPTMAHIQIMFYTAIDLDAEVRRIAAAAGIARIVTKPAEPETLLASVRAVLDSVPVARHADTADLDQAYLRQLTRTLHQHVETLKAEVYARSQAEAQLRAQTARLTILADASRAFAAASHDYPAALDLVARATAEALGDTCVLYLLPDNSAATPPATLYDADAATCARLLAGWQALPFAPEEDHCAQLVLARATPLLLVRDERAEPVRAECQLMPLLGVHSLIIAPLLVKGRAIGLLYLLRHQAARPPHTDDDLQIVQDLADRAALALTSGRLLAQLQSELAERTRVEDEMRRLNAELRNSQARLISIIDSAMDAIITIDASQRITIWNTAAERMFGYPASAARGQPLDRFIPEAYRAVHREHVRAFGRTGATARARGALHALAALRADGTEFPIEASISQVASGERTLYTVILRDITARIQAETALRSSEDRFAKVFQTSPVAMIINALPDQRVLHVNDSFLRMVGLARDARSGWSAAFNVWNDPHERARAMEQLREHGAIRDQEITMFTASGATRNVLLSADTLQLGGEHCVITSLYDISERKQSELALRASTEQLQALSRRLVAIQEAERRHLARELHDEIGQMLTGLNLLLETGQAFSHHALVARLREAQAVVTDLTARVRTLSLDLRPSMLDDLGLLPTLIWHFERYTTQTQVRVVFKHRGLAQALDPVLAVAVYRVVQEALTNVARYAQIGEAVVAVWTQGDLVVVSIEDAGCGFDLEAALATRRSSGLAGMRERVALLGGQLLIDTALGQGTRVLVELPLHRPEWLEGAAPWAG